MLSRLYESKNLHWIYFVIMNHFLSQEEFIMHSWHIRLSKYHTVSGKICLNVDFQTQWKTALASHPMIFFPSVLTFWIMKTTFFQNKTSLKLRYTCGNKISRISCCMMDLADWNEKDGGPHLVNQWCINYFLPKSVILIGFKLRSTF